MPGQPASQSQSQSPASLAVALLQALLPGVQPVFPRAKLWVGCLPTGTGRCGDELVEQDFLVGAEWLWKHRDDIDMVITARASPGDRKSLAWQAVGALVTAQLNPLHAGDGRHLDLAVGHPQEAVDRQHAADSAIVVEHEKIMRLHLDVDFKVAWHLSSARALRVDMKQILMAHTLRYAHCDPVAVGGLLARAGTVRALLARITCALAILTLRKCAKPAKPGALADLTGTVAPIAGSGEHLTADAGAGGALLRDLALQDSCASASGIFECQPDPTGDRLALLGRGSLVFGRWGLGFADVVVERIVRAGGAVWRRFGGGAFGGRRVRSV